MPKPLSYFMADLAYVFADPKLLERAFTHRSAHHLNNERLEFLGDSILNFCVGALLFQKFPQLKEGQLSRMRANLVKGESLANLASKLKLGDYLILGEGERKSGGQQRLSILEDAFEALIGALYLDGGLELVQDKIQAWFLPILANLPLEVSEIDAKTQLQELLQGRGIPLPLYHLLKTEGLPHEQRFFISCEVPSLNLCREGLGRSRKAAEQEAAMQMLAALVEEESARDVPKIS